MEGSWPVGIASVSQMWNLRLALGIWLNITQSGIPSQLLIEDHDVATLLHFPKTSHCCTCGSVGS